MRVSRKHIAFVPWMGATLGGIAWLLRLALAWMQADESAMAWGTIGLFILAALVSYALYRLQEHLGGPQTMAVHLCILAVLTTGLIIVAVVWNKMVSLPVGFHANWLWIAPVLYVSIAVLVWLWGKTLARRKLETNNNAERRCDKVSAHR